MSKNKDQRGLRALHNERQRKAASQGAQAAFSQALALHQRGQVAAAQALYRNILQAVPNHFDALYLLGVTEAQTGRNSEAERLIRQALAINPRSAPAQSDLGNVLSALDRFPEALASFEAAVALKPDYAEAHIGRGNVLMKLGRNVEALANYDRAIALKPGLADAHSNRGSALLKLRRFEAAVASCDKAIAISPFHANAMSFRAEALKELGRLEEALVACEQALKLKPDLIGPWLVRGNIGFDDKRYDEAIAAYDRALAVKPDFAEAWLARGGALAELMRFEEAVAAYDRTLALKPDLDNLMGARLSAKLYACRWDNFDADCARLLTAVRSGARAATAGQLMPVEATAADQFACARRFAELLYPPLPDVLSRDAAYAHDRIRVAYLSADFREHPVSSLAVELFERHDRSRFEVHAIALNPDPPDPIRARLKAAFEHFIDVTKMTDEAVARLMREREIDIAIDLMGHTRGMRMNILALRPALVQASYLGYAATTGTEFIDYIIGDRTVTPFDHQPHFSERIVQLPDAFMPRDTTVTVAETPTRSAAGLPEQGFVFCAFNNSYKFTPKIFDVWMRLLHRVPDSVLWLRSQTGAMVRNLQDEAQARGIDPQRLVFAPALPQPEDHLARQRLADLFLDTVPYNAHTTASDALYAGLPVLTCRGETFAGRVAASSRVRHGPAGTGDRGSRNL